jgi:AcrR family transcriptional regulator
MKDKIVHKAADMFLQLGFKSVTMDDIAHELGISKKTIYNFFSNKTALVRETVLTVFSQISCGIDQICSLEKDPIEELYEIKKLVMQHLKDEQSSPQHQLQRYYPEVHATLKSMHYDKLSSCTLRNLERGMAMGLYRKNLDIEFISRIYFNGVQGIKDENLFPAHQFPKGPLYETYLEYHIRGIVTKEGLKSLKKFIDKTTENA